MPTTTDVRVNNLIINKMTQEQYDALPEKSPTELYVVEGDSNLIYAEQAVELPTAGENNLGRVFQYVGETDQNYINGYFYKCTKTGSSIVSGNATVTEYINMEGETPDPEYIPTFIFDKTVFDAYVLSQGKPENTSTSIIFTWDPDDETGDTLLTAHYNTNDSVSTILIDEAGEPLNQTYAILGFTTNFADPTEDPEAADQQWMNYEGHITIILPTVSSYAWENIDVQPAVDPLPSQSGNNGKFLTTDGTDASWATVNSLPDPINWNNAVLMSNGTTATWSYKPLVNTGGSNGGIAIGTNSSATSFMSFAVFGKVQSYDYSIAIGFGCYTKGSPAGGLAGHQIAIGYNSTTNGQGAIAIGRNAVVNLTTSNTWAIQLGGGTNTNPNTLKVGNYEMMSADGTIPTARLTKVNSTITLTAAGWSSNTQTVSVTGMTATGVVLVSPDPTDQADYTSAGILCRAQAAGTLTFTCDTTPSNDIDVVVVMM